MSENNPADPTPPEGAGRDIYVGNYEGDRAGEAAARVRRRGLQPSLGRVEGYEPRVQGLVVFQTPRPGNRAAPGSTVCLFIAAPPPPIPAAGERVADTGPTPSPPPGRHAEETDVGDIEEWWMQDGSYQDATIEIHKLTPRPVRANVAPDRSSAKNKAERDGVKASIAPGTTGVWRGSPGTRHSLREKIAEQLDTGVLLVWRKALLAWWCQHHPRRPIWLGSSKGLTAGALVGLAAFTTLLAVSHHAPSAPHPVVRAQTPGRSPAPLHTTAHPRSVTVAKGCRHTRRPGRHLPSRAIPVVRVVRYAPALPVRVSAPAVPVREPPRTAVPRREARAGAAEREFGFESPRGSQ
jgi:hypothetical protein